MYQRGLDQLQKTSDGDRLRVNDKSEMGEEVELETCVSGGKSKRSSSIMADS